MCSTDSQKRKTKQGGGGWEPSSKKIYKWLPSTKVYFDYRDHCEIEKYMEEQDWEWDQASKRERENMKVFFQGTQSQPGACKSKARNKRGEADWFVPGVSSASLCTYLLPNCNYGSIKHAQPDHPDSICADLSPWRKVQHSKFSVYTSYRFHIRNLREESLEKFQMSDHNSQQALIFKNQGLNLTVSSREPYLLSLKSFV